MEVSTWRAPALSPANRPLHWEDYDWEMGLSDEEEAVVYVAFPELLPMGDFDLKSLRKLQGASCNTMEVATIGTPTPHGGKSEKPRSKKATKKKQEAMEEKPVYSSQFYKAKEGDIILDCSPASEVSRGRK